jgi:hypothetical protein
LKEVEQCDEEGEDEEEDDDDDYYYCSKLEAGRYDNREENENKRR